MALLLSLQASALALLLAVSPASSQELQWPYNLPEGVVYYPQDEPLVKRGLQAIKHFQTKTPVAMKKMSPDPEEMFFLDYWLFEDDSDTNADRLKERSLEIPISNQSVEIPAPPLRPLTFEELKVRRDWTNFFGHNPLVKRFQCPQNYNNCSGVGQANLCCANGATCFKNGAGTVGCCPPGVTCGDGTTVGKCDTGSGYTPCDNTANGGCCIPGFTCYNLGCISTTTSTTTTTLPVATVCSTGYNSCAASLGGGCCATSLVCGSGTCTATSTTQAVVPAVLPTGTSTATSVITSVPTATTDTSAAAVIPAIVTTASSLLAICPTNYYFCSAYYRPGCCQVGRNCALTNCPAATASSTYISNGVTVAVPVGGSTGGTTYVTEAFITNTVAAFGLGNCMSAWTSCPQSLAGGCCATGWDCGTASCVSGTNVAAKEAPNGTGSSKMADGMGWILTGLGILVGVIMVLL